MADLRSRLVPVVASALILGGAASAQFSNNTSDIPTSGSANNSYSENVDFGDVDLDGDWDAIFADGGDLGNDQNRIWINNGGLQGGVVGVFVDQTASRFPSVNDDSRDIEFVDLDDDADLDIYTSNTSDKSNQTNRWWINDGGLQAGTTGFYTDDTAARWVNLGSGNSSIANNQLLADGFIDWSCDCDFGDLDNDGDMDLFHSTYGGTFGGKVPSRIFLNDGNGFFEEFNPSGFQLSGSQINNGNPALWAEGTQQANTTSTNGSQADIATTGLDIDLGDTDGDFDLDVLHGARQERPRFFINRLEETGSLIFRDRTNWVFPSNWASNDFNYEQEMADCDGDGDLDLYGLNWDGFNDVTFVNQGNGQFGNKLNLSSSGADDNEGDFIDYDNDGDLDLYVANFSGSDKLYRNNNNGGATFSWTYQGTQPGTGGTASLDADACDVDNDGDYDIFVAKDSGGKNVYLENTTQTPDTHAPYIPAVEGIGGGAASGGATPFRAQVYDNAPYYITWYNETFVEVSVNGSIVDNIPMKTSGGQIFRGEMPNNLVGDVTYRVISRDEYGNTGASTQLGYSNTGNTGLSYGCATPHVNGEMKLEILSEAREDTTLYFRMTDAVAFLPAVIVFSFAKQDPCLDVGSGVIFNTQAPFFAKRVGNPDANGEMVDNLFLAPGTAGLTFYMQGFSRQGGIPGPFSSTKGVELTVVP